VTSSWFLLGAPWDCSGSGRGEGDAPAALRAAGLADLVGADLGDAPTAIDSTHRDEQTGVLALPETVAAAHALAEALRGGMRANPGHRALVVGGDCSLLLGVFAHLRPVLGDVGLWSVDGHPDYYEATLSDTGETADLQLGLLTGDGPAPLVELGGRAPMVRTQHAALVGHRTSGLDPASAAELARVPAGLLTIDAEELVDGPRAAGARARAWADELDLPMWLHVDVDVLDPSALPAVTYPQDGGPDLVQLANALTPLAESPQLIGLSIADFRPDLDADGRQARQLVALVERLLG
jgi:arginase